MIDVKQFDLRNAANVGLVRAQDYQKTTIAGSVGYALKDSAVPDLLKLKNSRNDVQPSVIYEALQQSVVNGEIKPDTATILAALVRTESDGNPNCKTNGGDGNTYCGLFQVGTQYFQGDENVGEGTGNNFREHVVTKFNLGDKETRFTPEQFNNDINLQIKFAGELIESKKKIAQRSLGSDFDPTASDENAVKFMSKTAGAYLGGTKDDATDSLGTSNGQYRTMAAENISGISSQSGLSPSEMVKAGLGQEAYHPVADYNDTSDLVAQGPQYSHIDNNGEALAENDIIDPPDMDEELLEELEADDELLNETYQLLNTDDPNSGAYEVTPSNNTNRVNFTLLVMNMTAAYGGTDSIIEFDLLPDQITENVSSDFDSVVIPGRSEPYLNYTGGSNREISFTIKLHHALCINPKGIVKTVNALKALNYPSYQFGYIVPPFCYVRMGNFISFYGVSNPISVTWQKPIIYDEVTGDFIYSYADITLSFKQTNARAMDFRNLLGNGGNV